MHKVVTAMALTAALALAGGTAALAAKPDKQHAATPAPSPAPLQQLWSGTAPDATMKSTTVASATDPLTGNVWVAIPFEDRYWIFAPDGTYLESWGTSGRDPGQLDLTDAAQHPNGWGSIAFAPDGSFVIGDTGNYRIQVFDKDRNLVRSWGSFGSDDGQFIQIVTVATDGQTVAVGDGGRWDVQTFDMTGTHLQTFGGDIGAGAAAFTTDGRIVTTNGQNPYGAPLALATFNPDGSLATSIDLTFTGGDYSWVTTDAAGNAYVTTEIGHLPFTTIGTWEYAPDGTLLRQFAEGGDADSVSTAGDVLYVGRGVQLDGTGWRELKAYALPPLP